MIKRIIQTILLIVIIQGFFSTINSQNTSTQGKVILGLSVLDLPDNVKQVDCYSTKNAKNFPWGMRLAQTSDVSVDEIYTPLSGDLDHDGIPEIVVTQGYWSGHSTGKIQVFEGNDLSKKSRLIDLGVDVDYYCGAHVVLLRVPDKLNPTDTIGLIIVHTESGLRSYKYDGINNITLFKSNTTPVPEGTIASADFNNDGIPEVYCGNMVFDAYSLGLIGTGTSNSAQSYFHWTLERVSYAADVLPNVAGTELICGSVIYSVDVANKAVNVVKTITPPAGFTSEGQTEVADFDGDGLLDVLVKQNSTTFGVYAYNPRTDKILFSKNIVSGTEQNFPLIGDIDADKKAEIVLLYQNTMNAYKYDGTNLNEFWSIPIQDASGSTGMTLFDFNQDGLKEIVYRDEANLRIINGSKKSHLTGADTTIYNLSIFPVASKTIAEYPIIVDCDADGEAEILLQGRASGSTSSRLHMFKSLIAGAWAPARTVWNQYAYNITNVNENLTIPKTPFNNATYFPNGKQPFNNFQEQATLINKNGDPFFKAQFDTTHIDTSIFKGQSYTFGTKIYTDATTDTLILKNIFGCDSTVILNLSVYPDNIELMNCYTHPTSFTFGIKQLAASTDDLITTTTPMVGDVDGDGNTEILCFVTGSKDGIPAYKDIDVFNGKTLALKGTVSTPYCKNGHVFAIADVDGAGGEPPYIFLASDSTYGVSESNTTALNSSTTAFYVFSYKYDASSGKYVQVWKSNAQITAPSASTTIRVADLNNDGVPEVIVGAYVFNAKDGVLLAKNDLLTQSIPDTRTSSYMFPLLPYIGNLLGDDKLEIAYLNELYSVNITNTDAYNANAFTKLLTAPAELNNKIGNFVGSDFNNDGHVDLVMVNRADFTATFSNAVEIVIWDVYNNKLLASAQTPNIPYYSGDYFFFTGVPLVGDVNGDGIPEVCFITKNKMYCYAYNGTTTLNKFWEYTLVDPSGNTGITLFDFNQDGKQEIVYRDEDNLHIIDGSTSTPTAKASILCASPTANEMVVVADVNNDGAAEMIIIGGTYHRAGIGKLRVYGSSTTNAWAPARPVWNQMAYNVVNVNKDLTIPKVQFNQATLFPNGKRPFNAYLQQATTINQNGDPFFKLNSDTTRIDTTILKGQSYIFGTNTYTIPTKDTLILKNTSGCNSVFILNLRVIALKSYKYIACPSSQVTLEVVKEAGKTYAWYSAKTSGTLLDSDTMLIYTKTTATVDTVWLQVDSEPRVAVPIYLSTICASTTETACPDGTILFKEDFGGNNPSDPAVKPAGIPQVSYTYDPAMLGWGLYSIRKVTHPHARGIWYSSDDHTFPNDATRGYLMQIDANEAAGQFYTYTLSNICPGSHLTFSCWMKSILNTNFLNKANVIFELLKPNGDMVAKYYSGDVPDADNTWKQYGFDFFSPQTSDTLILNIINNGSGSNGNDFVMDDIEIRLCVPPVTVSISPKDTVCAGDSISINAQFVNDGSFTEPLAYKWFKKVNPTDSWTELSTNATRLTLKSVTLSDQGYYRVAVSSSGSINLKNCRAMSDSVYLKVNQCATVTDSFCTGHTYSFNGNTLDSAGVYVDTLTSSFGTDSIVTLKLTENPIKNSTVTKNICYGTSYNFNGHLLTASGTYKDTIATTGCDSIVTLQLVVKNIAHVTVTAGLCSKESYTFAGQTLSTPGTYSHTYQTSDGCDSVVTLILKSNMNDTTYIDAKINEGETYLFGQKNLTMSGIYNQKTQTVDGCDSIIILNLLVDSSPDSAFVVPAQGFSPNGDGVNDYFEIANIEKYPQNHILIFNRWGNKVYEGKPYMNQWDGRDYFGLKMGGDLLPAGTYFYILNLGNDSKIKKGFVYLNR